MLIAKKAEQLMLFGFFISVAHQSLIKNSVVFLVVVVE